MRNKQKAFSLLELLIVLALISILMGIFLPSLESFSYRTKDQLLQTTILQTIHLARQQAHIQRMPVGLCGSKDQKTCTASWERGMLVFVDQNKDGSIQNTAQILATKLLPIPHGSLHLRFYPYYRNYLLFLPYGLDNNTDGTFWHCHGKKDPPIWAIMLSKTGRVRVAYPNKKGVIQDRHRKWLSCGRAIL